MTAFIGSVILQTEISNNNAICCSEDGYVSIVTEHGVFILYLDARSSSQQKGLSVVKSKVIVAMDYKPYFGTFDCDIFKVCTYDEQSKIVLDHTCNTDQTAFKERGIRQAEWSPKGADKFGSCLLAVLSYRHTVAIYSNIPGISWNEVCNLTSAWQTYLQTSKGQDILQPTVTAASKFSDFQHICYSQAVISLSWSPILSLSDVRTQPPARYLLLSVALKSGHIIFWKVNCPAEDDKDFEVSHVIDGNGSIVTRMHFFEISKTQLYLCIGYDNGTSKLYTVLLTSSDVQRVDPTHDLWLETDRIAVNDFCWCPQVNMLIMVKGQYIIVFGVDVSSEVTVVKQLHLQQVNTKYPVSAISYSHPDLYVTTVEGVLYHGSLPSNSSGSEIQFQAIDVPWTLAAAKNHGHGWLMSKTVMVLSEMAMSYSCIPRGPNSLKVHWLSMKTFEDVSEMLLNHGGLMSEVTDALLCVKYCVSSGQPWPENLLALVGDQQLWCNLSAHHLKLLRYLKQLQLLYVENAEAKANMTQDLARVEDMIVSVYIKNVVGSLLSQEDLADVTFSDTDRTVLSLMHQHSKTSATNDDDVLLQRFAEFCEQQNIPQMSEPCLICHSDINFSSISSDVCKNGHHFSRCCQTLRLCQYVPYRICSFCNKMAMSTNGCDCSQWLRQLLTHQCTFCDGRLQ